MQYQIYYILITVNILDKFLDTNLFNVFKATKLFCIYIMYKEKYLKYKTKYLELKNQLGGSNLDIKYKDNKLIIKDTINNITLSIKYKEGFISIQTTNDDIYTICIDPLHESFLEENNVYWRDMLRQLNSKNKIIYNRLFLTAVDELNKNLFNMKEQFIEQFNIYITHIS